MLAFRLVVSIRCDISRSVDTGVLCTSNVDLVLRMTSFHVRSFWLNIILIEKRGKIEKIKSLRRARESFLFLLCINQVGSKTACIFETEEEYNPYTT